jgi:sulfoxide reductase heme-binding subunit YedZ
MPSIRRIKIAVFVAALLPMCALVWGAATDGLGANPIEKITRETGTWTLRFLLIALAITPVRRLTGWNAIIQLRRPLGLFAFFYGTLHFATYLVLDQFFAIDMILDDIMKRPFITVGFAGLLMMLPLAVTSTSGWIRRLGGRTWQRLHRVVYLSATAGVLHYLWLVKADTSRPLRYAALLALLLGIRLAWSLRRRTGWAVPRPSPRATVPSKVGDSPLL